MTSEREVARMKAVYGEYAATGVLSGRWSSDNAGNRAIDAERTAALRAMLDRAGLLPLRARRILDIGCGRGEVLASLVELGAEEASLLGVDLLPNEIAHARANHPGIQYAIANAERLELGAETFDLALLFTVFTSILNDGMAAHVAGEVTRVLRPGGFVVWYDFRYDNPGNRHVRGVGRRRIAGLFPGFDQHLRTLTVLPPLARRLGRTTPWLYPALARIPPLRTHYLGLLRKRS